MIWDEYAFRDVQWFASPWVQRPYTVLAYVVAVCTLFDVMLPQTVD
jgi:hypothetical protein